MRGDKKVKDNFLPTHEKILRNFEVQKKVLAGLEDVKNGNLIAGKKAIKDIKKKYGI